jgi:predicted lipoprotein with Yx(FWY)xxD motif
MVCTGLAAAGYADGAYTVDTAIIKIGGVETPVLTDAKGMTLYYFMLDTTTRSACAGDCAVIWPPLLSTPAPGPKEKLPGKLTVVLTANGAQAAYNGHLLYTYSGDDAVGQANGQGIGGKWWVATVDLTPASAPTFPVPPGGYGGEHEGGKGGMGGGY